MGCWSAKPQPHKPRKHLQYANRFFYNEETENHKVGFFQEFSAIKKQAHVNKGVGEKIMK